MQKIVENSTQDALSEVDTLLSQVRQQIASGERKFSLKYGKKDGKTTLEVSLESTPAPVAEQKVTEVLPVGAKGKSRAIAD